MAHVEANSQEHLGCVLVADDSRVFRAVISETLHEHGLEVLEACDGGEALRIMNARRPRLVILDGLMPVLSGLQVLETLRASTPDYQPVIFMITAVYKSRRWEADTRREFPIAEYLEKPIEPDEVVAAISRHFPAFPGPANMTA